MKIFPLLFCLICTFNPLFSDEPYLNNQEVISHKLKALIISGDHFYPPEYILKTTEGVLLYRTFAPNSQSEQIFFTKGLERKVLNKSVTIADIKKYKEEIAKYFLNSCNKYVFIELIKGSSDPSILVLKVIESKIGEVLVSGNKWFSAEYYKKNVGLFPEGTIDNDRLTADINKINKSPWTKAEILYHKDKNDTVNIELKVQDKKPVQAYSGVINNLVTSLGSSRIFAGGTWYSSGSLNNSICVEYESAANLKKYHAVAIDMNFPFKNYGLVLLHSKSSFMNISKVKGEGFLLEGSGSVELPFFYQTLKRERALSFGATYKLLNNDFFVGGSKLVRPVSITECFVNFHGTVLEEEYELSGSLDVFIQPFALAPLVSRKSYSLLRDDASTTFAYAKAVVDFTYNFHDLFPSIHMKGAFQWSSTKLLPSEQWSLGGENSIRGYSQSAVNVDTGWLLSVEARSPKVSLLKWIAKKHRKKDAFSAAIFVDTAQGRQMYSENIFMLGAGPGLRYDLLDRIHAKVDLGFRLANLPENYRDSGRVRFNFSVVGSY